MDTSDILIRLADTLNQRRQASPDSSYVASLLHKGEDAILKKIAEESAETIMASKDGDREAVAREMADLWFHSLVLLTYHGLRPEDVLSVLAEREGMSGITEKAARKSK